MKTLRGAGSEPRAFPSIIPLKQGLNTFPSSVEKRLAFVELIREALKQGVPPSFLERELEISHYYSRRLASGRCFPGPKLVERVGLDRILQAITKWHDLEVKALQTISTRRFWNPKRLLKAMGDGMNISTLQVLLDRLEARGWIERDELEPRYFWITKVGERELRLRACR
jgi:predicted transcriptional regulator